MTSEQWHNLPEDAKKVWDMLSQEVKALILKPRPPSAPNPGGRHPFPPRMGRPPPTRQNKVNAHELETLIASLHNLHGGSQPDNTDEVDSVDGAISAPEEIDEQHPLLAHLT